MTDTTVTDVVTDALVGFGCEREEITRAATFESLDIDSLDLAELAQVIEERFGVVLKGSDVVTLKTLGDLIDLIVARA
ncbi:MAG TPA: phosphopantetheine-binding protein [Solirubrobacteraceae bacterium]|nr:phosphopantetheine-binding protein [Solirubrobacteraceae bacterium]